MISLFGMAYFRKGPAASFQGVYPLLKWPDICSCLMDARLRALSGGQQAKFEVPAGIQVPEKKRKVSLSDPHTCRWIQKSCITWDIRLHENPPWDHVFPVGNGVMFNQLLFEQTEGKQLVSMVRGHTSLLLLLVPKAFMFVPFGFPHTKEKR